MYPSTAPEGFPPPPAPLPTETPFYKKWWFWMAISVPAFVCCCVPIGAAVGLPAMIRYVKQSKATEATANLEQMKIGVETLCRETGELPDAAGPSPAIPMERKQPFVADGSFVRIGFAPSMPVYYSYSIAPVTGGIELRAAGDLDGNGVTSLYTIRCTSGCACDAQIAERDPLE